MFSSSVLFKGMVSETTCVKMLFNSKLMVNQMGAILNVWHKYLKNVWLF